MPGEISFSLPVYRAEFYHNTPGTDGVWHRVFNVAEIGDEKKDALEALKVARKIFLDDGFDDLRVYRVYIEKLEVPEGGNSGNR